MKIAAAERRKQQLENANADVKLCIASEKSTDRKRKRGVSSSNGETPLHNGRKSKLTQSSSYFRLGDTLTNTTPMKQRLQPQGKMYSRVATEANIAQIKATIPLD